MEDRCRKGNPTFKCPLNTNLVAYKIWLTCLVTWLNPDGGFCGLLLPCTSAGSVLDSSIIGMGFQRGG
ncbi:hypothetical protein WJX73_004580 [Symbiochloris irregularis]|uniref:Uncharacterized protein n=1 Tax=Symbiochloris irregularis TaxID=706552 RepID=A0AAW1NRI4_9CHLO